MFSYKHFFNLKPLLIVGSTLLVLGLMLLPARVQAAPSCEEGPGVLHSINEKECERAQSANQSDAVNAQCQEDTSREDQCKLVGKCQNADNLAENCSLVTDIKIIVNLLSALVGIVIVIMITVGGVQYSAARDNPQAVAAARGRITNAIIALVAYILLYGVLQYLIPGGLL